MERVNCEPVKRRLEWTDEPGMRTVTCSSCSRAYASMAALPSYEKMRVNLPPLSLATLGRPDQMSCSTPLACGSNSQVSGCRR